MKRAVRWTHAAIQDLDTILAYIAEANPETAYKIFIGIRQECERLEDFSFSGRVVPELKKQNISLYRELVVVPWRIIYRVNEQVVYVLAVFDGRRQLYDVLLSRILNT